MNPSYVYRATVARVVDGDTIRCMMSLGLRTYREESLRVRDVNAPELNTAEGKAARDWLLVLLPPGRSVVVQTHLDRQTFGRYVADLWVEGRLLADLLVEAGHAVRVA